MQQRQYERAIADYNAALSLNPRNATALYGKGHVCEQAKRYSEARAAYQACIEAAGPDDGPLILTAQISLERIEQV